jgi:hypothetical protein
MGQFDTSEDKPRPEKDDVDEPSHPHRTWVGQVVGSLVVAGGVFSAVDGLLHALEELISAATHLWEVFNSR